MDPTTSRSASTQATPWPRLSSVAHKNGLPQAVVSELTRAFVEQEVAVEVQLREALAAETQLLGQNAGQRISTVQNFIRQTCGAHAAGAIEAIGTAAAVQAWEAVMQKLGSAPHPKAPGETFYPSMNRPPALPRPATPATAGRKFGDGWYVSMPRK